MMLARCVVARSEPEGIKTVTEEPAPPGDHSRARARSKKSKSGIRRDQRPQRVRHCIHLLLTRQWKKGLTIHELSVKWKTNPRTVMGYASEASRVIHAEVAIDEEAKAVLLSGIDSIALEAHEIVEAALKERKYGEAGKLLSVKLDALKAYADISGAKAATKVEVSNNLTDLMDQVHREQELQSKTTA